MRLAGTPFIQAERSSGRALHLLRVTGRSGMRAAPGCALIPGARALGDEACFGASVQEEAVARWWTAGEPGEADVQRQAVKLPSSARPLAPGQQGLEWSEPAARFSLPAGPSRVELTLAPETWAVLLDGVGDPVDLCAPSVKLGTFLAQGGEVMLAGGGERRAQAVLLTGAPGGRAALSEGLFEAVSPLAGATAIAIAADPRERTIEVTGARACLLRLADGRRASSCTARLPANASGEIVAESAGGPLRAVAYAGALAPALYPRLPPAGKPSPFAEGQAAPLAPGFERSIALEQSAVVHVRATAGVCALVSAGGAREVAGDGLAPPSLAVPRSLLRPHRRMSRAARNARPPSVAITLGRHTAGKSRARAVRRAKLGAASADGGPALNRAERHVDEIGRRQRLDDLLELRVHVSASSAPTWPSERMETKRQAPSPWTSR